MQDPAQLHICSCGAIEQPAKVDKRVENKPREASRVTLSAALRSRPRIVSGTLCAHTVLFLDRTPTALRCNRWHYRVRSRTGRIVLMAKGMLRGFMMSHSRSNNLTPSHTRTQSPHPTTSNMTGITPAARMPIPQYTNTFVSTATARHGQRAHDSRHTSATHRPHRSA